jgi:hypothetical protein
MANAKQQFARVGVNHPAAIANAKRPLAGLGINHSRATDPKEDLSSVRVDHAVPVIAFIAHRPSLEKTRSDQRNRRARHDGLMALPQRSDLVEHTTAERRSLSPVLRWVAVAGAVAGAVLYSNWLLEIVFTHTLPDPDLYISELAAADQPHGDWFRGCDLAAAVALIIAAAAALVGVRVGRWSNWGWWALGVFAVATGLDSTVWRLVCAPSSEAACAAREASGTVPVGHQLHWLSSGLALAAAIASLLAFAVADFREGAPAPVRRIGLFMLAAVVGTAIWTGIAIIIDSADAAGMVGIAQRAELTAFADWLIYVALRTARIRIRTTP